MAKKLYEESHIANIAEAIRSGDQSLEFVKYKTSDMANGVNTALRLARNSAETYGYNKGFTEGDTSGYQRGHSEGWYDGKDEGREEGIELAKSQFADEYQDGGNRINYAHAYAGVGWDNDFFKTMRFDFIPSNAYMMFRDSGISGDFVELLASMGRIFDTSNCTNMTYLFCGSGLTRVGVISAEKASAADHIFRDTDIHTVDEFRLKADGSTTFASTFLNAKSLVRITIVGTIGQNFDIKYSPLDLPSAVSVLTHLKDYSGTSNEYKYKISFHESVWILLDAEGDTASPNGNSWRQYVDDKCWNA